MALLTNADIAAARNLVAAVGQAGGDVPQPLTNILEAEALLAPPHPIPNPAQAIVSCAADGSLTEQRLDELIESAARAQVISFPGSSPQLPASPPSRRRSARKGTSH